jgi:hypothetical protein
MSDMCAGQQAGDAARPGRGAVPPSDVDLGRVWAGVAAEVWRRTPGPLERLAGWLLRSPGLARALLTTPSLLLPWLIASAAVLGAGAAATLARSANVGVAAGLAGWAITVLSGRAAAGQFTAAVSDPALVIPYLVFAACCAAVVVYATRIQRGTS